MLNATMSYRLDVGSGKSVEFYDRATNLTNELAFAHTSFVKDQSPLRDRNISLGMRHQFCRISRCHVRTEIRITDRKSVVYVKRVSVLLVSGGRRQLKKK